MLHLYRVPGLGENAINRIRRVSGFDASIQTEYCLYFGLDSPLNDREYGVVKRYLATSYMPEGIGEESHLVACPTILEVGPKRTFETVASSTTVAVFRDCGLSQIRRIERSIRLGLPEKLTKQEEDRFLDSLFRGRIFDFQTQERYYQPLETFDTDLEPEPVVWIDVVGGGREALVAAGKQMGLALDDQDYDHLFEQFHNRLRYNPSDACVFGCATEMSEHCSHAGVWKAARTIDGIPCERTLMEESLAALKANPGNARVVGDEFSAFRGLRPVKVLVPSKPDEPSAYELRTVMLHPCFSDESHCHPSKGCPFWGAATGVARVRDNTSGGRGAIMGHGWFGMCVGNLCIPGYIQQWEPVGWRPIGAVQPLQIAIEGRNGAWYFGNALGEPVLGGFFIALGLDPGDGKFRSYFKPIVFTGGHSLVREEHADKHEPKPGWKMGIIGGPLLNVGYGGGTRSSTSAGFGDNLDEAEAFDLNSVQRGDPAMQNTDIRVITALVEMELINPIETMGDCGAGGVFTKLVELAKKLGIYAELRAVPSGDKTMAVTVLLNNESQEKHLVVYQPENEPLIARVAERFSSLFAPIATFTDDHQLVWHDSWDDTRPVDIPMDVIFGARPQKRWDIKRVHPARHPLVLPRSLSAKKAADLVLRHPTVAGKGWLANRVDHSVRGGTVQQSCVGPWQLPVADCMIYATSIQDTLGTATAIGVQPLAGLVSPKAMAKHALTEALLGLSSAEISDLADVCLEVNWFADAKAEGEGVTIDETARSLTEAEIKALIRQLGGKDSVSGHNLAVNPEGEMVDVKWPVTVVVTAEVQMPDMRRRVTPLLEHDTLIHVDFCPEAKPLGASILGQVHSQVGNDCPDFDFGRVIAYMRTGQKLLREGLIRSLHDISDGGLFTTISEMAFCSGVGLDVSTSGKFGWRKHYHSLVPGVVIGCIAKDAAKIVRSFRRSGVPASVIGKVRRSKTKPTIRICHNRKAVLSEPMLRLRSAWLETSFRMDEIDAKPELIAQERVALATNLTPPPFRLTFKPERPHAKEIRFIDRPKAAIIWTPGSNGDRELAAMAYEGGFEPVDIVIKDLARGKISLDVCQLRMEAGGFSYIDEPFEAGVGWAATVEQNERVREEDQRFRARADTLIYSPCNAAQMNLLLGTAPFPELPRERRPRFLVNESEVFESRFVAVKILPSPAVMFQGMEDSILGIIIAHHEGRLYCHDPAVLERILREGLAPMRYVGFDGELATTYPDLPNGSPEAIAALCTADGRFVVTMPHIERVFLPWQWPWMPRKWRQWGVSPWMKCLDNMRRWCLEHRS